MPFQSYQLWEIERSKTIAEQRAADVRAGEFAAAMARSFRQAGRQLRAVTAQRPGLGRPAARAGARAAACVRVSD